MTCCKVQPQISNNCTLLNKLIFRCARHFCLLRNLQKIWALNQNYKMMVDDSLLQSTNMQKIPTLRLHLRQLFPQGNLNENHLFFCFIIQTRNLLSLLDVTGEGVCHRALIVHCLCVTNDSHNLSRATNTANFYHSDAIVTYWVLIKYTSNFCFSMIFTKNLWLK